MWDARQFSLIHVLPQQLSILVIRQKISHFVKAGLILLRDMSPGELEPVDGRALKAGDHRLHAVDVVQLVQFLGGKGKIKQMVSSANETDTLVLI